MATAITYRTGESASAKRTVLVEGAHKSVVLLPAGRLEVLTGKLIHGKSCRHRDWAEWLDTDPESDDFAVLMDQVTQRQDIGPVKIKRGTCK